MDVIAQLEKALECPCCLERPRPDATSVGMCLNGHMTCHPCGTQILDATSPCPICRQKNFQIVRGHKLAMSILNIVTAVLIYTCKHPNCDLEFIGTELTRHEERCPKKPIRCPKTTCLYSGPLTTFYNGQHTCVQVCPINVAKQSWNFELDLNLLYSFDRDEPIISGQFKPILLEGITEDGIVNHAFINAEKLLNSVVIYSGWLNTKLHLNDEHKNLKIDMFVYVNTKHGKMGQFVSKKPKFDQEKVEYLEDGVFVNHQDLYWWGKMSMKFKCKECPNKKERPHAHIEVTLQK